MTRENLILLHMNSKDKDQPSYPCSLTNAFLSTIWKIIYSIQTWFKRNSNIQDKIIKLFPCLTQLSKKFQLLIKAQVLKNKYFSCFNTRRCCWTIFGILTIMSRINFVLEKSFITSRHGRIKPQYICWYAPAQYMHVHVLHTLKYFKPFHRCEIGKKVDPDELLQNVASHQGLPYFLSWNLYTAFEKRKKKSTSNHDSFFMIKTLKNECCSFCQWSFKGYDCHAIYILALWLPTGTKCCLLCVIYWSFSSISIANCVDPDQAAPLGAAWSGSTLFVCWN